MNLLMVLMMCTDDDEWKNQTINSINDDMDLLISYINGDTDRNI